jgi:hypothetical protein
VAPFRLHLVLVLCTTVAGGVSPLFAGLQWRAHALGGALGALVPRDEPAQREPLVLEEELVPVSTGGVGVGEAPVGKGPGRRAKAANPAKAAPRSLHVDAATVLRLAERGRVPTARWAPETAARPAGLRLAGVQSLGIGLVDGDVLVEVEGRPVVTPGEVVGAVIGARARRKAMMSARIYRGVSPILLTVEMPYPEERPARPSRSPAVAVRAR